MIIALRTLAPALAALLLLTACGSAENGPARDPAMAGVAGPDAAVGAGAGGTLPTTADQAPAAAADATGQAADEMPSLAAGSRLVEIHGRVERVSDDWWGIVPDFDAGTRFAPTPALAAELRVAGLRVVVSGTVGEVPPDIRMWGLPLAVESVRRE